MITLLISISVDGQHQPSTRQLINPDRGLLQQVPLPYQVDHLMKQVLLLREQKQMLFTDTHTDSIYVDCNTLYQDTIYRDHAYGIDTIIGCTYTIDTTYSISYGTLYGRHIRILSVNYTLTNGIPGIRKYEFWMHDGRIELGMYTDVFFAEAIQQQTQHVQEEIPGGYVLDVTIQQTLHDRYKTTYGRGRYHLSQLQWLVAKHDLKHLKKALQKKKKKDKNKNITRA